MKINLIPVSHQELATIEIETDEFIIGRTEEPFASAAAEITSYMSRRHTRIFCDNDCFWIADLGSLNGTKVNGKVISEQPVKLKQNDEIEIAGNLKFTTEIINPQLDATVLIQKQHNELTLEPVNKQSGLDILVITCFPFLISKEAGIFTSFQVDYAAEMSEISRRHAYISVEQGNYKLIDMGSTNGTFINNKRIDEQGKVLQQGDIISFGGDFFAYIVKLNGTDPELIDKDATKISQAPYPELDNESELYGKGVEGQAAPGNDAAVELRTTFVNDPSPFLDILYDDDGFDSGANEPDKDVVANKSAKSSGQKKSFIRRKLVFLQQIIAALKDNKAHKSNWRYISLFSAILVTIVGGTFYYIHNRSADIETLIKKGDYSAAAQQSARMLDLDPENAVLLNLSTKAILNSTVPQWQVNLSNREFSQAEQHVKAAQINFASNEEATRALSLMLWINRLYQFMSMRNGNAKIVMFQNEQLLSNLIEEWQQNKKQNKLTLALIQRNVPAFKSTYQETLSFIRTLEHDQDIYLNAIGVLKSQLSNKLLNSQTDGLMEVVTQFEQKYPVISGTEDLKFDIVRYIELNEALQSTDMDAVNTLQQQLVFRTPLFKQFAQQKLADKLPSEAFTTQYYNAINAWQSGNVENAMNTLNALSDDIWGLAALSKRQRYQLVLDQYNTLNSSRNSKQYVSNLFNFHALLQLPEDSYFLNEIESDFQDNKAQAVITIQNLVDKAQGNWRKYVNKGGIDSLLRMENNISKTFQYQAGLLSAAYDDISYAKRLYTEFKIPDDAQWKQTYTIISEEMDKQKKWLKDLELILKPSVLNKKLDLLHISEGQK